MPVGAGGQQSFDLGKSTIRRNTGGAQARGDQEVYSAINLSKIGHCATFGFIEVSDDSEYRMIVSRRRFFRAWLAVGASLRDRVEG